MPANFNSDVVQLRLPLKPEYLSVLRATVGVTAGSVNFDYGEIMQLRVVVSELFELAARHCSGSGGDDVLDVSIEVSPDRLEMRIGGPRDYLDGLAVEERQESQALLESLMDEVEFGAQGSMVRLVKYKAGARSTSGTS